jgi:hypothetical protein
MRKVLKIAAVIVAVLVAGLLVAWLCIDWIAKAGIEKGGAYALGVATNVDSVSLSLLGGEMKINGLKVANPEGWTTPHLMKAERIEVGLRLGSLMGDTVEVTRFEIQGLDMNIEQKLGSSNVSALLNNIKSTGGGGQKEQPKEAGGRKVKVERVVVRDVVAHAQVLPIGGKATTLDIKVPEITMDNVTQDNAAGVAVPELMRRLFPAILASVVDKGKGVLPDADVKKLSGDIASATESLGKGASNLVNQVGGGVGKLLDGLKPGGDLFKEPGKKGIGESLQDLLGGKKKPDDSSKPK